MQVDYGTVRVSEGLMSPEETRERLEELLRQMEGIVQWERKGDSFYVRITEADDPVCVTVNEEGIQIKGKGEMLEKGYYAVDYAYPEAVAFIVASFLTARAGVSDLVLHGLVSRDKSLQVALGLIENFTDIEKMRVYLPFLEGGKLTDAIPINLPLYKKIYPEKAVKKASEMMIDGIGKLITDTGDPTLAVYMVNKINAVKKWEKQALQTAREKLDKERIDFHQIKNSL